MVNPPPYAEQIEALVKSGVRIMEAAGSSPCKVIGAIKEAGIILIHKCTSVRYPFKDVLPIDVTTQRFIPRTQLFARTPECTAAGYAKPRTS